MVSGLSAVDIVGRGDEVEVLRALVMDVAAGRGRSVLVEGEPGIGKSALVAAGLADAQRVGCRVFWCLGDVSWQRLPLRVLADGLGVDVRELSWAESVAGLGGPADPMSAMVERLLERVDRLCAVTPVVLVLDDMQWVDEASALVWHRLSRSLEQLPLLLVAAGRPVPRRAEIAALRRGLVAGDTAVVSLGPLPEHDVLELVSGLVAAQVGPALRRFVTGAGGNPLFVRESVATLQRESRLWVRSGVAELTADAPSAPGSLAAAIEGRLGILSTGTAELMRLAALLGAEFAVVDLATVAGRPATRLTAMVEEALAAGVLADSGTRLAFRHPLVHQVLIEQTPDAERAVLHQRAARALAAAEAPVERVAQQLLAARELTDDWVLEWLNRAASTLTSRAPQVAAELLDRALQQLPPDDPRRERLATCLVTVLRLLARYDDVERIARPVLAHTTDPGCAGQTAWTLGYALMATGRHRQALEVTEQTLRGKPAPDSWSARLRALQAVILKGLGRNDEMAVAAAQAVAEGEQAGDRYAVSFGLHAQFLITNDMTERLKLLERALAVVADDPESSDLRIILHSNLLSNLEQLGRLSDAEQLVRELLALAERTATPRLATARARAGDFHIRLGRWDDALAELEAALELLEERPVADYMHVRVRGMLATIAAHRDDRTALRSHLAAVRGHDLTGAGLRGSSEDMLLAMALAAEQSGQIDVAVATLRQMLAPDYAEDHTGRYMGLPALVRLAIAVGDTALARAATQACIDDEESSATPMATFAARRCRGLLDADPDALRAAVGGYRAAGFSLELAETLEDLAVLSGQRGDTQTARTAYAEAVDLYEGLGAAWDVRRAQARVRPYGIGGSPRGAQTRPAHGWYALTPTERRIARLVADGLSNPDIAAELYLSRRTVQSHVSHILAKLQARSRREIAQQIARHPAAAP